MVKSRNEFEDIVHAIRRGGIDALVVAGDHGDEVVILQGAEHRYRVLVESFNDGAATLDANGTILYVNARFAEIMGQPREVLIGTDLLDHLPWRGRNDLKRLIRNQGRGEIVLKTTGQWERTIRVTAGPVKHAAKRHICLIASEETDMVKVTEALRSSEKSLSELSARLLQLQDDERRRIARDLHDMTGQSLAVQSMILGNLVKRHSNLDEETRNALSECAAINERVTQEVRTLSYLLHPPLLDEFGLASGIKWYAGGFEARSGIATSIEVDPDFPRLTPDLEIALFRVVQESLTNAHRHSECSNCQIRLKNTAGQVVLEIEDSGKGMRSEIGDKKGNTPSLGVGIQGMRERVRQLSGTLDVTSRENRGTVVTATLPFRKIDAASEENPGTKPRAARSPARKSGRAKSAKSAG